MRQLTKKILTGGGGIMAVTMGANIVNFLFNTYLGRVLKFEDYGVVTILNTLWYLISIPLDSLMNTVTRETAYLTGKKQHQHIHSFLSFTSNAAIKITLIFSLIWCIASSTLAAFFHLGSVLPVLLFAPLIPLGIYASITKGFLIGGLYLVPLTFVLFTESLTKMFSAIWFVLNNNGSAAYLSMPLSILFAFIGSFIVLRMMKLTPVRHYTYPFPGTYYVISILTTLSTIAFLTFDLVLVKHFLSPVDAGIYALLSLIGKMIYFFGALPNQMILTYVARDLGAEKEPYKSFYVFFIGNVMIALGSFVVLGVFGTYSIPLIFGDKSASVLPYIFNYTLALSIFTMAVSVIIFHLARRQYIFSVVSISMSVIMAVLIVLFHSDIQQIVRNVLIASTICFVLVILMHTAEKLGRLPGFKRGPLQLAVVKKK